MPRNRQGSHHLGPRWLRLCAPSDDRVYPRAGQGPDPGAATSPFKRDGEKNAALLLPCAKRGGGGAALLRRDGGGAGPRARSLNAPDCLTARSGRPSPMNRAPGLIQINAPIDPPGFPDRATQLLRCLPRPSPPARARLGAPAEKSLGAPNNSCADCVQRTSKSGSSGNARKSDPSSARTG